jgi:3-methylcrotonyl-CoA carboxylase alpha subunit
MFSRILIANRGEIACRVIRTARRLGIGTVAVYSDADRHALHVALADEAIHIGGSQASESYLCAERILDVAIEHDCEAVHPGYGFLSENAAFSRRCAERGVVFIGPPPAAIEAMGSKSAAKRIMEGAGVPLVPGYHGDDQDPALLRAQADAMGYPVLLKAVAGGGGKGMRQVHSGDDFATSLAAARREAQASFGDDAMLVEKYLLKPRHVEVQVFRDTQGNGVYLFERDCSVQRRHQKVIEEAPAPGMTAELRRAMGETALRAAEAIDYEGAGTVEFLLDADGTFYFMEMNTRLQVEHPVTEMITGEDLVAWQLRVAAGEPLPRSQDALSISGHAFEARIYAEDPDNDFLPVSGTLSYLETPDASRHVRIDTGVMRGDEVSVFYDPMIAKLIVWDEDRERALDRLATALAAYRVAGLTTNLRFLYNLATAEAFRAADLDTGFIERHRDALFHDRVEDEPAQAALAALYLLLAREQEARGAANGEHSPWQAVNGWRLNAPPRHRLALLINGRARTLQVEEIGHDSEHRFLLQGDTATHRAHGHLEGNTLHADLDGHRRRVSVARIDDTHYLFTGTEAIEFRVEEPDIGEADGDLHGGFTAPMNGRIVAVLAEPGQRVAADDGLVILEAMKMEHTVRAPTAGTVDEVFCAAGELVEGGSELLRFTAEAAS